MRALVVGGAAIVALLCASDASAFLCSRAGLEGPSLAWQTRVIEMQRSGVSADLPDASVIEQTLAASMEAWNDVDCSDITLSLGEPTDDRLAGFDWEAGTGSPDNHNILVFRGDDADDPLDEWVHGLGDIAITVVTFESNQGKILDADIEMNDATFRFTACDPGDCVVDTDLQNTLTHELGHVLGLDHSEVNIATMSFSAQRAEVTKRDLASDDVDAICTVYPEGVETGECFGVGRATPPDVRFEQTVCANGGQATPLAGLLVLLTLVRATRTGTDRLRRSGMRRPAR